MTDPNTPKLTDDELLEVLGPDWSRMSEWDRAAYGPKPTHKGRADRTRHLIEGLAGEFDGQVFWMRRAS